MRVMVQVLGVTRFGPFRAWGHLSGCHHVDPRMLNVHLIVLGPIMYSAPRQQRGHLWARWDVKGDRQQNLSQYTSKSICQLSWTGVFAQQSRGICPKRKRKRWTQWKENIPKINIMLEIFFSFLEFLNYLNSPILIFKSGSLKSNIESHRITYKSQKKKFRKPRKMANRASFRFLLKLVLWFCFHVLNRWKNSELYLMVFVFGFWLHNQLQFNNNNFYHKVK